MCKSFHIVRRCIVLFLVLVFLVTAGAYSTTPTVESFPSKAATMNADPISVVSPVSIPLSGEWSFSVEKDNSGEQQGWKTSNFNDSSWVSVQVPHTWNVMPEYSEYEGFAWYRRN